MVVGMGMSPAVGIVGRGSGHPRRSWQHKLWLLQSLVVVVKLWRRRKHDNLLLLLLLLLLQMMLPLAPRELLDRRNQR